MDESRAQPNPGGLSFVTALSKAPEGILVDVNDEWVRFFGFTKEEALGKTSKDLGINPDEEARKRISEELQKTGSVRDIELQLKTKSGEWRTCLINLDMLTIGGQKYFLTVLEDVSKGNPFRK